MVQKLEFGGFWWYSQKGAYTCLGLAASVPRSEVLTRITVFSDRTCSYCPARPCWNLAVGQCFQDPVCGPSLSEPLGMLVRNTDSAQLLIRPNEGMGPEHLYCYQNDTFVP